MNVLCVNGRAAAVIMSLVLLFHAVALAPPQESYSTLETGSGTCYGTPGPPATSSFKVSFPPNVTTYFSAVDDVLTVVQLHATGEDEPLAVGTSRGGHNGSASISTFGGYFVNITWGSGKYYPAGTIFSGTSATWSDCTSTVMPTNGSQIAKVVCKVALTSYDSGSASPPVTYMLPCVATYKYHVDS